MTGARDCKNFRTLDGPSTRMPGRRELLFSPLPYIVIYQIIGNEVEISRIFDGAQDWP
jgi:plasmid stabilization system protein ParE